MNIEKPSFKKICLMHLQALTNFPYIEKDFDAITDYELLCKVVDYLNQVISNNNEQNTVVENLYNAFVELKDYVDNYFDNLDVQDEINNKLDEMAEDGTLDQIIEQYLKSSAIWGFNTVADMKSATNLINGSYARTLGYHTINDGGGATYKIREITNQDVVDEGSIIALNDQNLIAELIIKDSVNPEQFGAYGDNTHDDKNAIQNMFDADYNNMIMNKKYLISDSITLKGENKKLHGVGSIKCNHETNPALILNVWGSEISINYIEGTNGIKLRATEESDHWIQYVRFKNIEFNVTDKCIECERTTNKWINELHFEDVRFNGSYGFYFMGDYLNGGYRFINCGNENCTTAFIKAYNLSNIDILGIRNAEAINYTFMDIENECYNFNINTSAEIKLGKIILNPLVNNTGSITACLCDSGQTRIGNYARCINGRFLIMPNTNKGIRLTANSDTYDFKNSETDNLLYNNITLDYVEGGHAYSVILPLLYNNFTEEFLTINTYSSLNTLSLTIGNNTYNLSFTDGQGVYKVINFRETIYIYKLPASQVNPS